LLKVLKLARDELSISKGEPDYLTAPSSSWIGSYVMKPLRIGTRRSQLALWQTNYVVEQLHQYHPTRLVEVVTFTTQGDRAIDTPLPEIGGKGLFTLELEHALQRGEIDLAVHSLKDLPTKMPDGFAIGAIPPRGSALDALVSRDGSHLDALPPGAAIGTSSLRRTAQLRAYRPDLQIHPIRGNVESRLRKTLDPLGEYHATVLALAGLERLGKADFITQILDSQIMLPAPGQGAIAIQCRADDADVLAILTPLDHSETRACVDAERAFLGYLEAGCSLPVSAYARPSADTLHLTGRVNSLDGKKTITVEGNAPILENLELAGRLAQEALAAGAADLLADLPEKTRP
jgi:hydroxymethylbilane synthase